MAAGSERMEDMQYLVMLYDDEASMNEFGTPEFEAEMAGYAAFGEVAGEAIVGGEALVPSSASRTIRIEGGTVAVTDGPFAEAAEVLGGFYLLEAPTLDDCIELVRHIPASSTGASEIRPVAMLLEQSTAPVPEGAVRYLATIHAAPEDTAVPGTEGWDQVAAAHGRFAEQAGDLIAGGGGHHPACSASTVRVRDGELQVTDGPCPSGAHIVTGFYLLTGAPEAVLEAASAIPTAPGGAIDLRPVMELGG
jgi:hypothetical protein